MVVITLALNLLLESLKKLICSLFIISLGSCVFIGKHFDDSHVKDLKKGLTTKLQVLDLFGLPFEERAENGVCILIYSEKTRFLVGPNLQKDLEMSFDKNNVLKSFRYAYNNP